LGTKTKPIRLPRLAVFTLRNTLGEPEKSKVAERPSVEFWGECKECQAQILIKADPSGELLLCSLFHHLIQPHNQELECVQVNSVNPVNSVTSLSPPQVTKPSRSKTTGKSVTFKRFTKSLPRPATRTIWIGLHA
jgi:hypothetical protein